MGQNGRMLVRLQVGHKSDLLVPALPNGHAHRWTVFVKSYEGDDFKDRSFVEMVRFDLHPDFPNPKRYVKEPPFKVTETGYGGFSLSVFIWLAGKQYRVNYDLNLSMGTETASSGGSSASSHSSERREQKRIPKLAPSQKDREAFSAPLTSVDAATVRRKIDLLTNPDKVFEVAFLLLDLDDTSHISTTKTGLPSLSYDLSNVDQKSLLRIESVLKRS